MKKTTLIIASLLSLSTITAQADVVNAQTLMDKYTASAKLVDKDFTASAIEGKMFFNRTFKNDGHEAACATCHTQNPANYGKHVVTKKEIKPLSPMVNPKRFTNIDKVEEKFTEHCNDILGADCSAQEKAHFIKYLFTEKTPS
jgi:cytochrome c peroxidase